MQKKALVFILLLFATAAFAAGGTPVSYPSGSETVHGVLFQPAAKGAHPAIVVIHEWWGVTPWIKDEASKLSDQGYVTLVVDLYRGQTASDPETAHELMRGLPRDRALRDLQAAVTYLKQKKFVDGKRLGAIGWCMGGGYAAELAAATPHLKAVAINYGALPTDPTTIQGIKPAILGIFGGQDRGIPVASVQAFEGAMKKAGKNIEVHIYPDAGHAFQNPANQQGYRPTDAADAWQHILAFFKRTL